MADRSRNSVYMGMKEVFRRVPYLMLAAAAAFGVFAFAVWLPNLSFLWRVLSDPAASAGLKVRLPLQLLGSIATNFTALSATTTVLVSVFFGLNLAVIVYYFSRQRNALKDAHLTLGAGGLLSGMLGMGCAACGSAVITGLFAFIGASGAFAFLPLRGGEFTIIGISLFALSTLLVAKKISSPAVCANPSTSNKTTP